MDQLTASAITLFICLSANIATAQPRLCVLGDPVGDDLRKRAGDFYTALAAGDSEKATSFADGSTEITNLIIECCTAAEASTRLSELYTTRFGKREFPFTLSWQLQRTAQAMQKRIVILAGNHARTSSTLLFDSSCEFERDQHDWHLKSVAYPTREIDVNREYIQSTMQFYTVAEELLTSRPKASWQEMEPLLEGAAVTHVKLPDPLRKREAPASPFPYRRQIAEWKSLCSQRLSDAPIAKLISELPALPWLMNADDAIFVSSMEAGVELSFEPRYGRLQQAVFHNGADEGFCQYQGELPRGLTWKSSLSDVESVCGMPDDFDQTSVGAFFIYKDLGLEFDFAKPGVRLAENPIRHITVDLKPTTSPATRPVDFKRPAIQFRLRASVKAAASTFDELPNETLHGWLMRVDREVWMNEDCIADLQLDKNQQNQIIIAIQLTDAGAVIMKRLSKEHPGEVLAIVTEGRVLMGAKLQGELSNKLLISLPENSSADVMRVFKPLRRAVLLKPAR